MVRFDGQYLCVQVNRNNYNYLLKIARKSEHFEYIQNARIMVLSPTKEIVNKLKILEIPFHDSMKELVFDSETIQENDSEIKDNDFEKLYDFQKEGVRKLLSNNKNFLLADEQGLGKSVQGAMYLKLQQGSLPAIIICPASLKLNWSREIEKWTKVKTYIIEGRTPEYLSEEFIKKYPVWIINYDILGQENQEEKKAELERKKKCKENGEWYKARKLKVHGWCDEINRHDFRTIICDEVQYIAESETIRSRGVQQICENDSRKIFLSGTPYETKTIQFFTALHILDKRLFPNEWQFKMRYCDPKKTYFGWQFNGLSNGKELHEKISTLMIRRLKSEVLTQLPPKQRMVIYLQVSEKERKIYDVADQELTEALENKETNALVKLSALKQASVQAKKNSAIQWINDYLTINDKLVVFVYHKSTFESLMNEFKEISVGINGETSIKDRQKNVDLFQNDSKIKLFIGNIQACCTGITLTKANATCFIEFGRSYPQMVQAEDRVHRISQEADSVFAYYLVLPDSVDNDCMETINERSVNINKVMDNIDSKMFESENDMNLQVLKKYKERKHIK